jgi:hypothetical protein
MLFVNKIFNEDHIIIIYGKRKCLQKIQTGQQP